jgi:hypothetical protein
MPDELGQHILALGETMAEHSTELDDIHGALNEEYGEVAERSRQVTTVIEYLRRANGLIGDILDAIVVDKEQLEGTGVTVLGEEEKLSSTSASIQSALEGTNNQVAIDAKELTDASKGHVTALAEHTFMAITKENVAIIALQALRTNVSDLVLQAAATQNDIIEPGVLIVQAQEEATAASETAHSASEKLEEYGNSR